MKITDVETLKSAFTRLSGNDPSLKTVQVEKSLGDYKMYTFIEAARRSTALTSIEFRYIDEYVSAILRENELPITKINSWFYDSNSSLSMDEVAEVLSHNSTLTTLEIRPDEEYNKDLEHLKKALEDNISLKSLKLYGYCQNFDKSVYGGDLKLYDTLVNNLASLIKAANNLECFSIDCAQLNFIGDGSYEYVIDPVIVTKVAEALKSNTSLLELDLGNNGKPISDEITALLKRNRKLKEGKVVSDSALVTPLYAASASAQPRQEALGAKRDVDADEKSEPRKKLRG